MTIEKLNGIEVDWNDPRSIENLLIRMAELGLLEETEKDGQRVFKLTPDGLEQLRTKRD